MPNSSEIDSPEKIITDDHNSEYVSTVFTYLRVMNKRTDQEFHTPDFLLHNTIQSYYVFIYWNETELAFTLGSKCDKDDRIKLGFTDIKIFHENDQISCDFKVEPVNSYNGYCNTVNNLDFYDYLQLKFVFYIKHITYIIEGLFPKKSELYARLKSMYKEKKFADLRIYVKNTEFLAHKAIVGRNSTFAEMFEDSTEDNVNVININDLDPAIFEIILNFLYVGETEKIDFSKGKLTLLFNLLEAADKYKIDDLKMKLTDKTIKHLNKDNVIDILKFSENSNLKLLKKRCIYYITTYRAEICENELFKDMILKYPKITAEMLYFALQTIGGDYVSD